MLHLPPITSCKVKPKGQTVSSKTPTSKGLKRETLNMNAKQVNMNAKQIGSVDIWCCVKSGKRRRETDVVQAFWKVVDERDLLMG